MRILGYCVRYRGLVGVWWVIGGVYGGVYGGEKEGVWVLADTTLDFFGFLTLDKYIIKQQVIYKTIYSLQSYVV